MQNETTIESAPDLPEESEAVAESRLDVPVPVPDIGSSESDNYNEYQLESSQSSQDDDEYTIKHYDDKTKFFKQTTKTDIETLKFENISLLQIHSILHGEYANYIASHIMQLYITPPKMENQSNINTLMDIFDAVYFTNINFHRLNTNFSQITIDIKNIKNKKDKKIILYIIKHILGNTKAHIVISNDDNLPLLDRIYLYRHMHNHNFKKAENKKIEHFLWIYSLMKPIRSINGIQSATILEYTIGDEDVYIPKFEDMKQMQNKLNNYNYNMYDCGFTG